MTDAFNTYPLNSPEWMLRNCWYTDIKKVSAYTKRKIVEMGDAIHELFNLPRVIQWCGSQYQWIELGPYIIVRKRPNRKRHWYPRDLFIFTARQMTREEKDIASPPLGMLTGREKPRARRFI